MHTANAILCVALIIWIVTGVFGCIIGMDAGESLTCKQIKITNCGGTNI